MILEMLKILFRLHDFFSALLARHMQEAKRGLLLAAHLSLFGFFFPELRRDFGELALALLLVVLFLGPLSKIFRMRLLFQLVGLRRELGITMAYLATVHGLGFLLDPVWFRFLVEDPFFRRVIPWRDGYVFGMIAYLFTLPLLFTSNRIATQRLGRYWKRLHRVVYGVLAFALLHQLLVKSALEGDFLGAFAETLLLGGSYLLVKALSVRNFLPPLRSLITWVGLRYGEYQKEGGARNVLYSGG